MAAFQLPLPPTWLPIGVYIAFILYKLLRSGGREKNLPPGPPTLPIVGNAHLIPTKGFYAKMKEWSDQYGSVFSLKVGKSTIVVLNDRRAVHDLIDKRSAIYSDRPIEEQLEISFGSENFAMLHATPLWRAQRKVTSQLLTPTRLDTEVAKIQEAEISRLMHDLLLTPEEFRTHLKRTTSSVSSIVLYGHRAPTFECFWGSAVYTTMGKISKAIEPGSYLPVDQFPVLKYLPNRWNAGRQRAHDCYRTMTDTWNEARRLVDQRRAKGDKRNSLIDKLLNEDIKLDVQHSYTEFNNFLGAVHQGGADTTATAMLTHILHLAKYPQFQEKARIELDRVCGTDRVPLWSDFKDLPYINCIIKEGLRMHPVVPAGVPHRAKQDDWYEGMLIPKDASIFIPAYALNYSHGKEPEIYNPDRYINHPRLAMDYAGSPDYENRDHYSYGAGRRICVGIHLAERTQWRITARLLWAFKIEPAVDEATGETVKLDTTAYQDGFLCEPEPYRVRFVPRSEKHVDVVKREFEGVEDFLKEWE